MTVYLQIVWLPLRYIGKVAAHKSNYVYASGEKQHAT
jgi:hypothetical protein